jgi:hypothetical protein
VLMPKLRNSRDENEAAKRDETLADWEEKQAKKSKNSAAIDAAPPPTGALTGASGSTSQRVEKSGPSWISGAI